MGCVLLPRFEGERQRLLEDQRRTEKASFANISEWAVWPKLEVLKILKARSRALSVQEISDWALGEIDHRIVFADGCEPDTASR